MKVIEFFGMPRAGKTTQTKMLIEKFEQEGIVYDIFPKPKILIKQAETLEDLNMTLYEMLSWQYEKIKAENTNYLIYDRGFYDRIALSTADYERGALTERFKEKLTENLERKLETVDFPLLLLVNPETSWTRKKNQIRENIKNYKITKLRLPKNMSWLQHLFEVYKNLKEKYPEIHVINTEREREEIHKEIITILQE